MKSMYGGKNTSLSYHLAEALKAYIYSPSKRLDTRTDLLGFIAGSVEAMLGWKTLDTATSDALLEIDSDIEFLEANYEPIMDEIPYMFEKKAAYRAEQRKVLKKILRLIRSENLLSNDMLREVYAGKWGDTRRAPDDD